MLGVRERESGRKNPVGVGRERREERGRSLGRAKMGYAEIG